MLFIGICGASGSGKTTLADQLTADLAVPTTVIHQDCYYLDHSDMSFEDRCKLNYDEPGIFDHDLLYQDICTLLEGKSITRKSYDFTRHARADTNEEIVPNEVLIVEGIHTFYDKRLCDKMYLKLYISVEPDICLLRRISRDIKERGREIDNIAAQYLDTVKPMYDKYIRNYIHDADVIVARGGKNAKIVDILAGYVRDQLTLDHKKSENRNNE